MESYSSPFASRFVKLWHSVACLVGLVLALAAAGAATEQNVRCQLADGFDFPVGKPEASGYHKARGFIPRAHMGEDWDGDGGGDTDLGDPVYAIARGVVILSENVHHGWGNVILVRHIFREKDGNLAMVDSLYGHVLERRVKVGDHVERGQRIASIGTADGLYPAHLHLEIRKNLNIGMNCFNFAKDYSNYYSPTAFINAHRTCPSEWRKYEVAIDTFASFGENITEAQLKRVKAYSLAGNGATTVTTASSDSNVPGTPAGHGSKRASTSVNTDSTPKTVSTIPTPEPIGHGLNRLSIPVNTAPTPRSVPNSSPPSTNPGTTPSHASSSPPSTTTTEGKGDFWSRLKAKLSKGQVTSGADEFKKD